MSLFHERLLALRDESGKTQSKIATELGITRQAMSYIINGREPNFDMLVAIAEYFNVSVDYLLGKSDVLIADNEAAFSQLGLSEPAIEALKEMSACAKGEKACLMPHVYQERLDIINILLSNEKEINMLEEIASYIWHNYEKIPDQGDNFCPCDEETATHMRKLHVREKRSGKNYVFDPDMLIQATLLDIESMLMDYRKRYQEAK